VSQKEKNNQGPRVESRSASRRRQRKGTEEKTIFSRKAFTLGMGLVALALVWTYIVNKSRSGQELDTKFPIATAYTIPADERLKDEVNSQFVRRLRSLIGFDNSTSREELAQIAQQKAYDDVEWMKNQHVGQFINERSELITVWLDSNGETMFVVESRSTPYKPEVKYITPDRIFDKTINYDNNNVVVYGDEESVNQIALRWENNARIKTFLDQYFPKASQFNIFHINLIDPDFSKFPLTDVNGFGLGLQIDNFLARSYITKYDIPEVNYPVAEIDVIFNMSEIYTTNLDIGWTSSQGWVDSATNEAINFMADSIHTTSVTTVLPHSEAISSIGGLLAVYDNDFAQVALGGIAYNEVTPMVVDIMENFAP